MLDQRPQTILLVEDDAITALDLQEDFQSKGFDVIGPFADAGSAMTAITEDKPDLAVLDFFLRGGTATELAKHLEALNVPYVFVSTGASSIKQTDLRPLAVWSKPFKMDQLFDQISPSDNGPDQG